MSLSVIAGAALLATSIPLAWLAVSGRRTSVSPATLQRGFSVIPDGRTAALTQGASDRAVTPFISGLARRARRVTPAGMIERLEQRLVAAGLNTTWSIEQVLAAKLGATLVVAVFGGLIVVGNGFAPLSVLCLAIGLGMSWFGADAYIDGRAGDRQKAVRQSLADTMDQITISVEAGLGFEAAMARVAAESTTVLATELSRTLQDIQLGVPRSDALSALASRIDVPELRHFVVAVRQAERYGVPIAKVLRIQSAELREKRRQAAEEHAMKIPVKVLFPLVFCILPTLFIVLVGPVVLRFADTM